MTVISRRRESFMAEQRNGGEQLDIEESGVFAIADDSQIADMQR